MANFWKGKRVFLTGGSGLIGSALLSKLLDLGATVFATQHVHEVKDNRAVRFTGFDITDAFQFMDVPQEAFDVVFHLAAYPIVTKSEDNPDTAFGVNVVGTYNVIRSFPHSTIVVASTDKVYGRAPIPYNEDTPLLGTHQIYESTKTAADVLAQSFFYRGQKIAITRACNIFGYDEESTRIVPHIIVSLLRENIIQLRSGCQFTRDYLHVDDIVTGYLRLAEWRHWTDWANWQSPAFNFGGHNFGVCELIEKIADIMGVEPLYNVVGGGDEEIMSQSLDYGLVKHILNWEPRNFEIGMRKTIEEYSRKVV